MNTDKRKLHFDKSAINDFVSEAALPSFLSIKMASKSFSASNISFKLYRRGLMHLILLSQRVSDCDFMDSSTCFFKISQR